MRDAPAGFTPTLNFLPSHTNGVLLEGNFAQ